MKINKNIFTDLLISISLSNLLFVFGRGSVAALPLNAYHKYADSYFFIAQHTFIFCILGFALILFAAIRIDRYFNDGRPSKAGKAAFVLAVLVVLHEIRVYVFTHSEIAFIQNWLTNSMPRFLYLLLFVLIGAFIVFLEVKRRGIIVKAAKHFALILAPFFLVTLNYYVSEILTLRHSYQLQRKFEHKRKIPPLEPNAKPIENRVVWIIFDEFDYQIPFESEVIDQLPELKKFRQSSVFSTQAVAPAHDTLESFPSLLTGKIVKSVDYIGSDNLFLYFDDQTQAEFKDYPGVINQASEARKKIGVIGTSFHPYCRIYGEKLSFCMDWGLLADDASKEQRQQEEESLFHFNDLYYAMIKHHVSTSLNYFPFRFRLFGESAVAEVIEPFDTNTTQNEFEEMEKKTMEIAAHPDFDFVFMHLPIPHRPFIYDADSKTFNGEGNYISNLILTDRLLGSIRQSMEKTDLWENSTIIISSDHPWRLDMRPIEASDPAYKFSKGGKYDPRIPFMIKMKNQTKPIEFSEPINTVVTSEIILKIFNHSLNSPEELIEYMRNHRKINK